MGIAEEELLAEKMQLIRKKEKEREVEAKAQLLGLPYLSLARMPIPTDALSLIPEDRARGLQALCFLRSLDSIHIACVDPMNPELATLMQELEATHHITPKLFLISPSSFEAAMKFYIFASHPRVAEKGIALTEEDLIASQEGITHFKDLQHKLSDASVSDILATLTSGAVKFRASDIHFEVQEKGSVVRFRIDGVLHDIAPLPKELWQRTLSRIKLLSGLKLNIERAPQDGRFSITLAKEKVEVRVSIIPTAFGEDVVMRLLPASSAQISFSALGLRGRTLELLSQEMRRPQGMILNSGPTGSGKTTTLYALLHELNQPDIKIVTIEDPIEYQMQGIAQSQVNAASKYTQHQGSDAGYTFPAALRSMLRHDPDVIMVGELRDEETTEVAVQAALTGHLVFSTVHTNNAAATIPRLISLGAKPFLIAPALNLIIAQRLVRVLCSVCKEKIPPTPQLITRIKGAFGDSPVPEPLTLWQPKGCEACMGFGYKGRTGIFEMIHMSEELKTYILDKGESVSEYDILSIAKKQGMIPMVQDGLHKAFEGITTADEVFRVIE